MRRVAAAGLIAVTGGTTAVAILDDAADRRLRHAARTLYASSAGAGIAPCWLQAIQKYLHSRERDDDAVPSVAADDAQARQETITRRLPVVVLMGTSGAQATKQTLGRLGLPLLPLHVQVPSAGGLSPLAAGLDATAREWRLRGGDSAWEALLTAGIRGLHAVETAFAPQQAARRRIDGLCAALLHAVDAHERPTHGDGGDPHDVSSEPPTDADANPNLDPDAWSPARVVLLPLPGWPALSTAGAEGVEAASVAAVNAMRAHGRMLPLLTGGPRAREQAAALTEAVAVEEEEGAVVYVWPGVQDAIAPHDTDADAALCTLRGQLGDDSDHPGTSGTDAIDGTERVWDPSFLWMALGLINSPTPATLLGGSAAIAAAITPPLTAGATHAVTPQALLAEAPVPAHRQLTALWDAGVLRCGQEPVIQVPDMSADDPAQVLRAVLPAALSARSPTLRAFQSLQGSALHQYLDAAHELQHVQVVPQTLQAESAVLLEHAAELEADQQRFDAFEAAVAREIHSLCKGKVAEVTLEVSRQRSALDRRAEALTRQQRVLDDRQQELQLLVEHIRSDRACTA